MPQLLDRLNSHSKTNVHHAVIQTARMLRHELDGPQDAVAKLGAWRR